LHSIALENCSLRPLDDVCISANPESVSGEDHVATHAVAGDVTPLANNSVNISPNSNNTAVLVQSVEQSLILDRSMRPSHDDVTSVINSVQADYFAAHEINQQEIKLLREACEKKCQEVSMSVDELTALKIERDDIIKMQQAVIDRLRNDGMPTLYKLMMAFYFSHKFGEEIDMGEVSGVMSSLPPSFINEQALLSSLNEKEQVIQNLQSKLAEAEEKYDKQHEKVLDLEEIVKVLHEQNIECDQMLRQAQFECEHRADQLGRQGNAAGRHCNLEVFFGLDCMPDSNFEYNGIPFKFLLAFLREKPWY
uniref:GRIP domain-containing protein n=1 Tax=Gongylonema pulchrum TaxID=637853 RepID=A0A183DR05_9BILA